MKKRISAAFIAFLAATPPAHAYSLCMSSPLGSFEGFGAMSPDGRFIIAGKRLISVAEMREIGQVPGYGRFSPDSSRFFMFNESNGPAALDIVEVTRPGAPSRHLTFPSQGFNRLSPNGSVMLVTTSDVQRADADALGGSRHYYGFQLVRTADGVGVARMERAYEDEDLAFDQKEQLAVLYVHSFRPAGGEVFIVDIANAQTRRLNVNMSDDGAVAISPDGKVAVTSDFNADRTTFWDTASGNTLGTLSGVSSGLIAATQDSNWFFIDSIAVRRGEWTKPYRVQVPPHMEGAFDVRSDRIVARSQDGTVATFDASSLQPMLRSTSFGHRYWDQPTISAGNEVIAWSSSANQFADDKTVGTSNVVVLDGRDGHLLCRREVPQPADLRALGATAQRVVLMESDGHQHYTVNVYAIENEDAARARVRREVAQAKTTSAKLAPAKRAEAQGIFKQAFELFQAGEFATAARLFESGLAIDPGNVPANYYLGETYARLGNKDRAALYYTRAAAIAPTTKEGALASTRLSN